MKNRPDDPKGASRRQFTKAAIAALAAAPLAARARDEGGGGKPSSAGTPPDNRHGASPTNSGPAPFRTDHEPPVFYGGSFQLESDQRLKALRDNDKDKARPPKRQVLDADSSHQYRAIRQLHVYTEFDRHPTLETHRFEAGDNVQLRFWLRDVVSETNPDAGYKPINTGDRPEVIVSGNYDDGGKRTMLIESNRHLDHVKKTAKKSRREKHEHKHNNKEFRIGKWDVVKADGTQAHPGNDSSVAVNGEHAQRYIFMVVCDA